MSGVRPEEYWSYIHTLDEISRNEGRKFKGTILNEALFHKYCGYCL
jgi:hypothetical protein